MNHPELSPGQTAQVACLFEVSARKAGNVHRFCDFDDADYLDYLLSATAIVGPLDRAREVGVGASVLQAVEATRRLVATNTNLGMILLFAPLAAVPDDVPLAEGVLAVIRATTREDARLVYEAIRLARPGGLGEAPTQDVANEPTVTLYEAMCLAAERDLVARQYANGYTDVFRTGLPALGEALQAGRPLESAIALAHLAVMASHPDTLIARKRGRAEAMEAVRRAAKVLAAGWPDSDEGRSHFEALDDWLRAEGHARNPGATADVVAAALYAALRDGTIRLPRSRGEWSA
jgi:triphosphoribosyl-dephospho-CoA synthase